MLTWGSLTCQETEHANQYSLGHPLQMQFSDVWRRCCFHFPFFRRRLDGAGCCCTFCVHFLDSVVVPYSRWVNNGVARCRPLRSWKERHRSFRFILHIRLKRVTKLIIEGFCCVKFLHFIYFFIRYKKNHADTYKKSHQSMSATSLPLSHDTPLGGSGYCSGMLTPFGYWTHWDDMDWGW